MTCMYCVDMAKTISNHTTVDLLISSKHETVVSRACSSMEKRNTCRSGEVVTSRYIHYHKVTPWQSASCLNITLTFLLLKIQIGTAQGRSGQPPHHTEDKN